jgi:hypothetical protein
VAVLIAAAATDDGAMHCQINASGRRCGGVGRRARRLRRQQHRGSRDYRADSSRREYHICSAGGRERVGYEALSGRSRLRTKGKRGLVSWRTSGIIGKRHWPAGRSGRMRPTWHFAGYCSISSPVVPKDGRCTLRSANFGHPPCTPQIQSKPSLI